MELDNIPSLGPSFTSHEIFQKATLLCSLVGIRATWEKGVEYALPVKYRNFKTILTIGKVGKSIEIAIHTFSKDEDIPPCLQLQAGEYIKEDGSVTTDAYIDHIIAGKCKIPSSGAGTWLMQLANKLLCVLGVQEVGLLDLSAIHCKNSNRYARLIFLNVYKGKYKSWYENFGYQSKEEDKSTIMKAMKELRGMDAKNIVVELSGASVLPQYFDYNLEEERQKVREILEQNPPEDSSLGEYMSRMFDMNCDAYSRIDSFLIRTQGSWTSNIQFLHGTAIMFNNSVCTEK